MEQKNLKLSVEDHKRVKIEAVMHDVPFYQMLHLIIQEYFSNKEGNK